MVISSMKNSLNFWLNGLKDKSVSYYTLVIVRAVVVIENKPQQEGIPTKPSYTELFILILQKTSNNN